MKNSTKTANTTKTANKTDISFIVSDNKKINHISFESFKIAYIFARTNTKVLYLHYCVSKNTIDELKKLANVTVKINKNFDSDNKDNDAYKYDVRIATASYDTVTKKLVALLNSDDNVRKYIDRQTATKKTVSEVVKTAKTDKTATTSKKSIKTANKTVTTKTDKTAKTVKTDTDSKATSEAKTAMTA